MNIGLIIALLLSVAVLIFAVRIWLSYRFLWKVQQDSLIVFGKKGHGKTLLFSVMARQWAKRSKSHHYLSNTDFKHQGGLICPASVVNVDPNTWEDVLNDDVKTILDFGSEDMAIYLDDAGVYLPNFADSLLKKKYASMPIAFAVWRHLYNAPIHINSQDVGRCWKMVREQADGFLKARRVIRLGPVFRLSLTYFEKVNAAEKDLAPLRKRLFRGKVENDLYQAENGQIKDFAIWGVCCHHKYDSRYFRAVFFNPSPSVVNESEESEKSNGKR